MKPFKKAVFILLLSLNVSNLSAQDREVKTLTPEKRHKTVHHLLNRRSYYNAVDEMKELVKQYPDNIAYKEKLADAYFFSRDYKNAEKEYEKLINLNDKNVSLIVFRYAEALKYNGKYEEAKKIYSLFSTSKYKDKKGEKYKQFAANEVKSCEWAIKNSRHNNTTLQIDHLGDHVNSAYTEFSPCLYNDTILIFASLQSDSVITVSADEAHPFHVKLLASKKSGEEWGPHSDLPNINSDFENNANGTFSLDKTRFYFTRCVQVNHKMECKIYVSEVKDGIFQKPKKLGKDINIKGYTQTQPHISSVQVGKQSYEVMYFVSDKPGGKGGLDIWYTQVNKDGSFKPPVNAGTVNTIRDEVSPFYVVSSGTLYFSSNFHYGFGGYDVFKSKGQLNKWDSPQNLGKPVNTRVDDTYFSLYQGGKTGFLVSNRPEGYHLTSETCCDDIYSFKFTDPLYLKIDPPNATNYTLLELKDVSLIDQFYRDTVSVDSIPEKVSDKLQRVFSSSAFRYDTMEMTDAVSPIVAEAMKDDKNYFHLQKGKEYVLVTVAGEDTSIVTFATDKYSRRLSKSIADTTIASIDENYNPDYDVIKINLKQIKEKEKVEVIETKPEVEDEKTYTVGRLKENLEAKKDKMGLKVILNYEFDDANFIKDHSASLDSLVALMKEFKDIKINIFAHTDNKGSHKYNHDLSKKRAKSIEEYMHSKGVDKKRMHSKGMGETEPLVPNENPDGSDNPENRRINRRAEIIIVE
ncbi:MAG: OmpA family protein [Cytophagaceae bacterium]